MPWATNIDCSQDDPDSEIHRQVRECQGILQSLTDYQRRKALIH